MSLESLVAACSGIRVADKPQFLQRLTHPGDWSWVAGTAHPELKHLQGDLFRDFPFPILSETGELELHERTVLVLNNTCDLEPDRMDYVSVVPVLQLNEEVEANWQASFLTDAKANKVSDVFYIGPFAGNPKGLFANLGQPVHVPVNLFREQLTKGCRIASLTQKGAYVFQMKFMHHVARAETDEVQRL